MLRRLAGDSLKMVGVADHVDDVGHHAGEVVVLGGVDGGSVGSLLIGSTSQV
jgi:hypothetical protein